MPPIGLLAGRIPGILSLTRRLQTIEHPVPVDWFADSSFLSKDVLLEGSVDLLH